MTIDTHKLHVTTARTCFLTDEDLSTVTLEPGMNAEEVREVMGMADAVYSPTIPGVTRNTNPSRIVALMDAVEAHGAEAVRVFLCWYGPGADVGIMDDRFLGAYDEVSDYFDDIVEDMTKDWPEVAQDYFDADAWVRSQMANDYWAAQTQPGGPHFLFSRR